MGEIVNYPETQENMKKNSKRSEKSDSIVVQYRKLQN